MEKGSNYSLDKYVYVDKIYMKSTLGRKYKKKDLALQELKAQKKKFLIIK